MGCGSSKTLTKPGSIKEKFHTPLRKKTNGYEEILVSKNGTDHQFITLLCTSNTLAKKLKERESPKQTSADPSQTESFNSMALVIEEPEESEKYIETINSWELLAGLEDDNEIEEQNKEGSSKSMSSIKQCSESSMCAGVEQEDTKAMKQEELKHVGDGEKGLRRKVMATELAALKVPAFEFARTGSLRDWLMQGGQVMSHRSHETPKFGSFERPIASGISENCEENVFDPELVAQLEQAMEELTVEEEEILKRIVEKWEGNARRSF